MVKGSVSQSGLFGEKFRLGELEEYRSDFSRCFVAINTKFSTREDTSEGTTNVSREHVGAWDDRSRSTGGDRIIVSLNLDLRGSTASKQLSIGHSERRGQPR